MFYDVESVLAERHVSGRMAQFLKMRIPKDEHTLYRFEECRKNRVFRLLEERFNNPKATPEEASRFREALEKFLSKELRVFEYNALKKEFGLA